MQLEVAGHTNEIPMAPRVLNVLDLQGKIVTGDALLAQRGLSQFMVRPAATMSGPSKRINRDCAKTLSNVVPRIVFTGHESRHDQGANHDDRGEKPRPSDHADLNGLQFIDRVLRLAISQQVFKVSGAA